ncbi:hypothetical protein GCM10009660_36110 [Catellatospora bangladeshensis]
MVGPEERAVARVLGGARDAQQVVVGGPLLGLGEDAKVHGDKLIAPAVGHRAGAARPGPRPAAWGGVPGARGPATTPRGRPPPTPRSTGVVPAPP